jgi:hypothetical protein
LKVTEGALFFTGLSARTFINSKAMKDISKLFGCRMPELRSMVLKESQDSELPGFRKLIPRGGRRALDFKKLLCREQIFLAA